jgi:hypothetical protein
VIELVGKAVVKSEAPPHCDCLHVILVHQELTNNGILL